MARKLVLTAIILAIVAVGGAILVISRSPESADREVGEKGTQPISSDVTSDDEEAEASFQYFRKYLELDGGEKNADKALMLLRKAARMGHARPTMDSLLDLHSSSQGRSDPSAG